MEPPQGSGSGTSKTMRVTIKVKLAAAFTLVLGCLGAAAYLGVSSLAANNARLAHLVENTARQTDEALRIRYHAVQVSRNLWKIIALTDDAGIEAADKALHE